MNVWCDIEGYSMTAELIGRSGIVEIEDGKDGIDIGSVNIVMTGYRVVGLLRLRGLSEGGEVGRREANV